jgi:hypothetical protein
MTDDQESCPPGQIRSAAGNCMPDPATLGTIKRLGESGDNEKNGKRVRG